jgi:hypothetical protein
MVPKVAREMDKMNLGNKNADSCVTTSRQILPLLFHFLASCPLIFPSYFLSFSVHTCIFPIASNPMPRRRALLI